MSDVVLILLDLYRIETTADLIGAALRRAPTGTAPITKIHGFFLICSASPTSGIRIAAPIILEQHKRQERLGEVRKIIRRASPIVPEIAS